MPENFPIYVGQSKEEGFNNLGINKSMLDIIKIKHRKDYDIGHFSESGLDVYVSTTKEYMEIAFVNKLQDNCILMSFERGVFDSMHFQKPSQID